MNVWSLLVPLLMLQACSLKCKTKVFYKITKFSLPRVPRPNVPVLAAAAALTAAGGVGGLVVGAGSVAALGAEPDRRPLGVPLVAPFQRAP